MEIKKLILYMIGLLAYSVGVYYMGKRRGKRRGRREIMRRVSGKGTEGDSGRMKVSVEDKMLMMVLGIVLVIVIGAIVLGAMIIEKGR